MNTLYRMSLHRPHDPTPIEEPPVHPNPSPEEDPVPDHNPELPRADHFLTMSPTGSGWERGMHQFHQSIRPR